MNAPAEAFRFQALAKEIAADAPINRMQFSGANNIG
jgi:hypothetical protein